MAERLGGLRGASASAASVERVDVAGPGFLNLFMSDAWCRDALTRAIDAGDAYGGGRAEPRERVLVEFV